MEYLIASELPFDPKSQMGQIFAESYYQWLKYFAKDKAKLARAFAHIFNLDKFFVAVQDSEVLGFATCVGEKAEPVTLNKKILCKNLGFIRGRIAFAILNKHMIGTTYPFEVTEQMGIIEYVAVSENHRRKGVAQNLLNHIMTVEHYPEYVLEVAGNNTGAVKLYEKLGFIEFMRKPAPKKSDVSYLGYMIHKK